VLDPFGHKRGHRWWLQYGCHDRYNLQFRSRF
jgi:hypothetical protein